MVIWLFSGGGEAEVRGLKPFIEKFFPDHEIERKMPIRRKPGPRPSATANSKYGLTGKALIDEMPKRLRSSWINGERCDVVLVFDDLDCKDFVQQKEICFSLFESLKEMFEDEKICVGFAAPELESWLIADWDNSFAKHPDFRGRHNKMRHWLSAIKKFPFSNPEDFGSYDDRKGSCNEKMSTIIIESSTLDAADRFKPRFSKGKHTPEMLMDVNPETIKLKCPIFREFYNFLSEL